MWSDDLAARAAQCRRSLVFYTFFYTAGRYRLVRSGTDRYVECAKPQPRGTKRDRTGPGERPDIPHNPKVAGSNPAPATM